MKQGAGLAFLWAATTAVTACPRATLVSADDAGPASSDAPVDAAPAEQSLVDAATVTTCILSYECGLSHPGLGRSSDSTSVDLAACTRTVTSSRGPWRDDDVPNKADAPPPPVATKLEPARCSRLRTLTTDLTNVDVREAQESAKKDSTACTLTVSCPAGHRIASVQRQSLTGSSRVVKLLREL